MAIATIRALEIIDINKACKLFTDSTYVKQGINEWIKSWKLNNWKRKTGQPVINMDLWKKLDHLRHSRIGQTEFEFVKAHNGDIGKILILI